MEFGKFLFAPFGRAMVSKSELNIKQNKLWKAYSTVVMVLYFPLGLLMCLVGVFQVAALFITILGIPVALVVAKSLGTYLNPVNKKCVSKAVAEELQRRKAEVEVAKALGGGAPMRTQPLADAALSVTATKGPEPAAPAPASVATMAPVSPVTAETPVESVSSPVALAAPEEAVLEPTPAPLAPSPPLGQQASREEAAVGGPPTEPPVGRAKRTVPVVPLAILAMVLVAGAALAYVLLRDASGPDRVRQEERAPQAATVASGETAPASAAVPARPSAEISPVASVPGTLRPRTVRASSVAPSKKGDYAPEVAVDGNPETWWQENIQGDGIGEWLEVSWEGTAEVREVRLIGGYQKDRADRFGDRWVLNNRLRKVRVEFPGGNALESQLEDRKGYQSIPVPPGNRSSAVRVVILDVYPGFNKAGERIYDAGIAEIEVLGFR